MAISSPGDAEFEARVRGEIVAAARALDASGASFATFRNSRCNGRYWIRENNGGFRLRSGVTPAEGIRDIFRNGWQYAFECATAMVIVLYKGVLEAIGEPSFNNYFAGLVLYDWKYDSDLRIVTIGLNQTGLGDVVYFNNPDFDPRTPEWRGENAIVLPGGVYFAHGMGIVPAEAIIRSLNGKRKPGSGTSAYLINEAQTLDFAYIQRLRSIVARIGSRVYVYG
ncbi:protein-glutamine gamma-glutamyltransferase [Paenibacillus sp. M1]|uniref:Protein-glutamine gamma-glutamyltransferase n=1 Tax=Paenibacillus haidiansis TaxID=1574488 RepID=A0ABU7VV80_9BACL